MQLINSRQSETPIWLIPIWKLGWNWSKFPLLRATGRQKHQPKVMHELAWHRWFLVLSVRNWFVWREGLSGKDQNNLEGNLVTTWSHQKSQIWSCSDFGSCHTLHIDRMRGSIIQINCLIKKSRFCGRNDGGRLLAMLPCVRPCRPSSLEILLEWALQGLWWTMMKICSSWVVFSPLWRANLSAVWQVSHLVKVLRLGQRGPSSCWCSAHRRVASLGCTTDPGSPRSTLGWEYPWGFSSTWRMCSPGSTCPRQHTSKKQFHKFQLHQLFCIFTKS